MPDVSLLSTKVSRNVHSRPVGNSLPTMPPELEGINSKMRASTLPEGYSELSATCAASSWLPSPNHVRLILTHWVSVCSSSNP